ncbi:MAG: hypothetical protein EOO89_26410 [Pedobacter sp.]|nr:MAG: hypothetical protein EOO89_26410 [Pedobacter sp.]
MVTASLLSVFPIMTSMSESGRDSKLGSWTVAKAAWFHEKISPVFAALFEKMSEGSNAAVGEDESVELPFKVNNPKRRPDLEAEMLELVNAERRDNGLKPVEADPAIAEVAVKHSADMFARGYFSHLNPDGKTPFQRIRAEGVNFFTAGENLALAQTLDIAHRGLMNSPGHRANILRPAFGRLGIGILDGGIYGLMITQNFRN